MTDRRWDDQLRINIARLLRQVETLALDLHAQALATPNDREFPGGRALNMLGPAAVLQDWEALYEAKEEAEGDAWAKQPRLDPASSQTAAEEQPLNVLTFWTRVIREERDQPTSLSPTISRETDYLRKNLDWMTRADEFDEPAWMQAFELEKDLRTLVHTMEATIHDGPQRDLGVNCLDGCGRPLLKIWGIDPGTDRYVCVICERRYGIEEYHLAVRQAYMLEAEWLTADDMAAVYRVPAGTVTGWAAGDDPLVAKRRDPNTGRMVYRVVDVITRRDASA